MPSPDAGSPRVASVWWFAAGYFACYVPYSALTKAVSSGTVPGVARLTGIEMLPVSTFTSAVGMWLAFTWMGWWRHATHRRIGGASVPVPTRWTALSGLATSVIVVTTTLAYTFEGVSIPFVMLLMRGGVLLLAPVVDLLTRRKIRWFSWIALAMSAVALGDALFSDAGRALPILCAIDIAAYLAGYFVRLRFMSRLAKSADKEVSRRYFVEEQMVATPLAVGLLGALALFLPGAAGDALRRGFVDPWTNAALWPLLAIGLCSQGTGFFGGLVLLDASENTFCVPLNRASSVLAGVLASTVLALGTGTRLPAGFELVGAGLLVLAIVVLWWGGLRDARAARRA